MVEEVGRMMHLVHAIAAASFGQIGLAAGVATFAMVVMGRWI